MPTLPWARSDQPPAAAQAVVLASKLELRSYRHIPGFLRAALKARRQVRQSSGALGVSLVAQPLRKTFWTLSAWADRSSLDAFVATPPHVEIMRRFHEKLVRSSFTTWDQSVAELPEPNSNAKQLWSEAKDRLAAVASG